MPDTEWFPGATLNYAEHALGREEDLDAVAVVARSQTRAPVELTFGELRDQVARARAGHWHRHRARERVVRVAVVGTGVIGASWTTLFLSYGHEVVASDPAPGAEQRLRAAVTADQGRLSFTPDLAEAVADAGFVQENGPERPELKDELFAVLDAAAPPGTVLASSSSGLLPSRIQRACAAHPERVLVGHPFNPPHLIPLVEGVPGERTGEAAVEEAMGFYRSLGRHPIRLRQELPGHVANRLQAALWRETYSLVERGAASVADIDAAIAHGPGLRWALLGPFSTSTSRAARALDAELMDASAAYFKSGWDRTPTVERLAAYYRERRMAAVIFTVDATTGLGYPGLSSEEIAEAAASHPDVLIPFGSVDPHRPDAVARARALVLDHGVRGFKFHPSLQAFAPNAREHYPLYDAIQELGVPALFHTGQTGIGAGCPVGEASSCAGPIRCFWTTSPPTSPA